MSRIGKRVIKLPEKVTLKLDGDTIKVEGPNGKLDVKKIAGFEVRISGNEVSVEPQSNETPRSLWGLLNSLIKNAVDGASKDFEKRLQIQGIGYKADAVKSGKGLNLKVGYTHIVEYNAPDGIKLSVEKDIIIVSGRDKQLVGQVASNIRSIKKPEPYKGKGIRYEGEKVKIKAINTGGKK